MKKFFIMLSLMMALLALAGCVQGQDPDDAASSQKIMEEFDIVASRDIIGTSHIVSFMDEKIGLVTAEHASQMILRLEEKQEEYRMFFEQTFHTEDIQEKFQEEDDFEKDMNNPEELSDPVLKELVEGAVQNGFKIRAAEGSWFPVADYSYYDKYSKYADSEVKDYLKLMKIESEEASMADGALIVSWEEVIRRALAQETFVAAYPESTRAQVVSDLYQRYSSALFNGLPNSPVFEYDTRMLKGEVRSAFEKVLKEDGDGGLLEILSSFMEVLERNGYKLTEEVEAFLDGLAA